MSGASLNQSVAAPPVQNYYKPKEYNPDDHIDPLLRPESKYDLACDFLNFCNVFHFRSKLFGTNSMGDSLSNSFYVQKNDAKL